MLKGRFLGVAQNVGDAFCFLVLTEPEGTESSELPQVLARSVIRRRFLRLGDADPAGQVSGEGASLSFYLNDESTVLQDPPTDSEECDGVSDIVPPPSETCVAFLPNNNDSDDQVDDGVYEVYGPPVKRPRLSTGYEDDVLPVPNDPVPQRLALDSEECDVRSPTTHKVHQPSTTTTPNVNKNSPVMMTPPDPYGNCTAASIADTTAVSASDDVREVAQSHTAADFDSATVTQDEDVNPDILESITHQLHRTAEDSTDDELFTTIEGHEWLDGVLHFCVKWTTDEVSSIPFKMMQRDYPSETASYILKHKVTPTGSRFTSGRYTRWARTYNRLFNRVVRRLFRLSDGVSVASDLTTSLKISTNLPNGARLIRRVTHAVGKPGGGRKRKKPGRISRPVLIKYGVTVPRSVRHAYELDRESGTTFWTDAIKKEIESLLALECFSFHDPGYKPNSDFQFAKLSMIFEVKQDGRRKARLVAGGHMIDPNGINSRSTVVKGISVRLLDLIAHRDNLKILCRDIGNAFITADCLEKVYPRAGPEFGDKEEAILVFKKAAWASLHVGMIATFGYANGKIAMVMTSYALTSMTLR